MSCKIHKESLAIQINNRIFKNGAKDAVSNVFLKRCDISGKQNDTRFIENGVIEVSSNPFPYFCIQNFVTNHKNEEPTNYLKSLSEELLSLNFKQKSNDLFKFVQSDDLMLKSNDTGSALKCSSSPQLKKFCSLLKTELLTWLHETTEAEINDNISMFCAQYKCTDVLLCHDDELEHRRFAYVYYLTENWKESDGGTLDLFNVNESFQPTTVEKSVSPTQNLLILFEVSQSSFHQVSEIISKNKTRLSLSGWFHGKALPRIPISLDRELTMFSFLPSRSDIELLSNWISPEYLSLGTQASIQEQFEDTSEIQLKNFLIPEKYNELLKNLQTLKSFEQIWEKLGPPNRRKYQALNPNVVLESTTEIVDKFHKEIMGNAALNMVCEFIKLMMSEEMFLYLSNISGLSFHPMAVNDSDSEDSELSDNEVPLKKTKLDKPTPGLNSKCRYEVRSWSNGDYSLLRDNDNERGEYALDVNLHFGADDWSQNYGGTISYITEGEDEELLTIVPASNCLSIAYRDKDALRFVKHINCMAVSPFFDVSFVYKE